MSKTQLPLLTSVILLCPILSWQKTPHNLILGSCCCAQVMSKAQLPLLTSVIMLGHCKMSGNPKNPTNPAAMCR